MVTSESVTPAGRSRYDTTGPGAGLEDLHWHAYENFPDDSLDESRWFRQQRQLADGSVWYYAEPNEEVKFSEGAMEIRVDRFERSNDTIQGLDNAKVLMVSRRIFDVPPDGRLAVSGWLAAEKLGGNASDIRDGAASLHVVEFETGLVLDLMTTGERVSAIWERMPYDAPNAFTYLIDDPLHCPPSTPGQWQKLTVLIDAEMRVARYFVDDVPIYTVGLEVAPKRVQIAMGMLTVHLLKDGRSVSLHGQGLVGRWKDIQVGTS
jgi:hypothetical protein